MLDKKQIAFNEHTEPREWTSQTMSEGEREKKEADKFVITEESREQNKFS